MPAFLSITIVTSSPDAIVELKEKLNRGAPAKVSSVAFPCMTTPEETVNVASPVEFALLVRLGSLGWAVDHESLNLRQREVEARAKKGTTREYASIAI